MFTAEQGQGAHRLASQRRDEDGTQGLGDVRRDRAQVAFDAQAAAQDVHATLAATMGAHKREVWNGLMQMQNTQQNPEQPPVLS